MAPKTRLTTAASTSRTIRPGSAPSTALTAPSAGTETSPGDDAADDGLDPDAREPGQLEMRQASIQDRQQDERLEPRRDGDRQGDARQAERADEDDRERAVDGDRTDRRGDRRDRVLARVEGAGEDGDERMRRQPDRERDEGDRDEVEVCRADVPATEQRVDDGLPDDRGQDGDRAPSRR